MDSAEPFRRQMRFPLEKPEAPAFLAFPRGA
jgi:hypothetical protein